MPQDSQFLVPFGTGYAPMATGIQHAPRFPTEGLPFMSNGGFGAMAGMAAMPAMYRAFGQVGMVPMGVGHDQNVYDRMMAQRFTQMQMDAMRMAAESDRAAMMQTMRGMAAMTGTPFGAEQRYAAQALTNRMVAFAPMSAYMMPDVMDQMGGLRGSATVLASRMMDAGRYRIDPVTGLMGMSAESGGRITRDIYTDLFSPNNLRQMRGVSAGQAGALFQELQMRGMVGTAATEGGFGGYRADDPRSAAFRATQELGFQQPSELIRAARNVGVDLNKPLSGGDLDKLAGDSAVSDRMRSFDADKIKRTLKNYAGTVAAMRDIFGDMGKPNAPMNELMAGLEALTQGSMAQLDPQRAGMMARQTYNLARQTGVTLDNALVMQQHAAARGQQLGLEPIFAVQAAQGGLAFGGAYRAQGHAANTAWGMMNSDQLTQLDVNLRQQAAASGMANRLGTVMRLSQAAGGFTAGSDAARMVAAIRAGTTEFQDASGKLRSLNMSDQELIRMMTGAKAGITEGDVMALLGQTDTNREAIERFGIGGTVRRAQRDELRSFVGFRMTETLAGRLGDVGIKADQEVLGRVGQSAAQRIFAMSTADIRDTQRREAGISSILEDELSKAGYGPALQRMPKAEKDRFLRQTADRFFGHTNQKLVGSIYASYGNILNVHAAQNDQILDAADRNAMQARHSAEVAEAMSGLGSGSILSRAVTAIQQAQPGDDQAALKVLASALGGVRQEDINQALLPKLREVADSRRSFEDLQAQVARETDPVKRADLNNRLESAKRQLRQQSDNLAKFGEQFGAFATPSLTGEDLSRAQRSVGGLITAQNDLVGLRGNFGQQISPEQLAAGRARFPGLSDGQVRAALREERLQTPWRASKAAIDALVAGGMTPEDAREVANARLRAKRLGVDVAQGGSAQDELNRIADAFRRQSEMSLTVTDADRAAFRALGIKGPTDDQIGRFMANNPEMQGKSKEEVMAAMEDQMILRRRQAGHRERFSSFWASPEGSAFREQADYASQDVENVASKLMSGEDMVRRYGAGSLKAASRLRSGQERLETLAMYHSRGDVARLMAGDLNIDATTPEGKAELARVMAERTSILMEQSRIIAEFKDREGKAGKQFLLGDEAEAKSLQGIEAKAVGLYRKLTPDEEKDLSSGDPEKIRKIAERLGASPTEMDQIKSISRQYGEMGKAASAAEADSPMKMVRGLITELGGTPGEETATQREMALAMEGTRGRGIGRQFLGTSKTIREVAERGGHRKGREGIEDLRSAYAAAVGSKDPTVLEKFKKDYGFDKPDTAAEHPWLDFTEAMRYQQSTGLLRYSGKESDLLRMYNQALQGGVAPRPATDGPGSERGPQRIEGDLTIHWKGDYGVGQITAVGRDHLTSPA